MSGLGGVDASTGSARCLTQMSMSNRRVGTYPPALPKSHKGRCGKGAYRLMGLIIFQVNVSFQQGLGFSPLGDRERRAKQRQYPKRSGVVDGRGVCQPSGLLLCEVPDWESLNVDGYAFTLQDCVVAFLSR